MHWNVPSSGIQDSVEEVAMMLGGKKGNASMIATERRMFDDIFIGSMLNTIQDAYTSEHQEDKCPGSM